jgi:hypothetical protein
MLTFHCKGLASTSLTCKQMEPDDCMAWIGMMSMGDRTECFVQTEGYTKVFGAKLQSWFINMTRSKH